MPIPIESPFKQLKSDLTKVALKSGLAAFVVNAIVSGKADPTTKVLGEVGMSAGAGVTNRLFGIMDDHSTHEHDKKNNLPNIAESFLVGANPIAIVEILSSYLTPGMKAIALTGLALANAMLMYGSRRLADMEDKGGGKDLQG
ncbi:MAG: hypothetical protein WC744_00165 [Patescibacteria group bacterium]|jgi:hypothetical protein